MAGKLHLREWKNGTGCAVSRRNIENPFYGSASLAILNRENIRWLVFLYTGHAPINKHLHMMGLVESPLCGKCGDETSLHHVGRCPIFMFKRMEYLHWYSAPSDIIKIAHRKDLLAFLHATERFLKSSQ